MERVVKKEMVVMEDQVGMAVMVMKTQSLKK